MHRGKASRSWLARLGRLRDGRGSSCTFERRLGGGRSDGDGVNSSSSNKGCDNPISTRPGYLLLHKTATNFRENEISLANAASRTT